MTRLDWRIMQFEDRLVGILLVVLSGILLGTVALPAKNLTRDLRDQYTLGYVPPHEANPEAVICSFWLALSVLLPCLYHVCKGVFRYDIPNQGRENQAIVPVE